MDIILIVFIVIAILLILIFSVGHVYFVKLDWFHLASVNFQVAKARRCRANNARSRSSRDCFFGV